MKDECHHENVQKLMYLRPGFSGVHGPYFEVWLVRCQDCGERVEQEFEKD